MWAGGEMLWPRGGGSERPNLLRVGQTVTETTRLLSAEPKIIRKTSEEMVVVGVEKTFENEDGVALIDKRETRKEGERDPEYVVPERIKYRATNPLYAEEEYHIVLEDEQRSSKVNIYNPEGKLIDINTYRRGNEENATGTLEVIPDCLLFFNPEAMRVTPLTPLLRTAARTQYKNISIKPSIISQTRQFNLPSLSSFAPQFSAPEPRSLSATRTLPFAPLPLFKTISSIDSYGDFLPFLTASKVTAHDPVTGYPTRAYLTIGYGPLSETFESKVECDEKKWFVGARSGDIALQHKQNPGDSRLGSAGSDSKGECIFEYLDTIWQLEPLKRGMNGAERTKVDLTVRFQFRSAFHATVMAAVESQVAGLMIEAFEKRMIEGGRR
ncbi:uncharacterized protein GIQ15_02238 [Arthroderma uncinatum]|uniref:uncharacterized protein n=1 Tax=Arthroderma uncinatum TaxID=74035 RepID=UPI00144A6168|nr:uncharacterized protein GIQ15_02238 [Arthroderma uncinatum]KAF3482914.1 hypothetical protein GIQ15_02238 [Arthroderma uncinatum]